MRAAVVVFGLLALAACTKDNDIRLSFGDTLRIPLGFRCKDADGKALVQRGLTTPGRTLKVSVMVDFIGLEGFPTCHLSDIVNFCEDHECRPITNPPLRKCKELEKQLAAGEDAQGALYDMLKGLAGTVLTEDAPDQTVILRVAAAAQPCDEILASGFDTAELVGCVFSCPLQLDLVSGDVLLDLPAFNDSCEPQVDACAGQTFRGQ
jgi:hypothetical protein